jgi:hypothetical protein
MSLFRGRVGIVGALLWLAVAAAGWLAAEEPSPLEERQEELAEQFRDLERSLLRLADLLSASDPRRAAVLRRAFEQADELDIDARLANIVGFLRDGQLIKAGSAQGGAIENMRLLLDLLESGDSDRRLTNTKEEVKRYLSKLSKLIAKQRDIEGSTESGGAAEPLAERQESVADETRALAEELGGFAKRLDERGGQNEKKEDPASEGKSSEGKSSEGKSSEGKSSEGKSSEGKSSEGKSQDAGDSESGESGESQQSPEGSDGDDEASRARRSRQRLDAAGKRMKQAQERLEEARRKEAREDQEKAIEELETARAELEEILRQIREEEVERLLVQLESRIRAMLRSEKGVLAGCDKLQATASSAQPATAAQARERELEASRLAREQSAVAADAGRALVLVRDDGSAVAIPEALEQVRLDCLQSAARLGRGDVGATTRGIVQDVVTSLEEMLAALEKAQREQQQRQQQGQGGGRPSQPGEQPLVDKLSELKMIRTLQMRINTRTRRFAQLLDEGVEQAEEPDLVDAVRKLAERQVKVERAARDIATGRTE